MPKDKATATLDVVKNSSSDFDSPSVCSPVLSSLRCWAPQVGKLDHVGHVLPACCLSLRHSHYSTPSPTPSEAFLERAGSCRHPRVDEQEQREPHVSRGD